MAMRFRSTIAVRIISNVRQQLRRAFDRFGRVWPLDYFFLAQVPASLYTEKIGFPRSVLWRLVYCVIVCHLDDEI